MFIVKSLLKTGLGKQSAQQLNIDKQDKYCTTKAKIMFILNKYIDNFN